MKSQYEKQNKMWNAIGKSLVKTNKTHFLLYKCCHWHNHQMEWFLFSFFFYLFRNIRSVVVGFWLVSVFSSFFSLPGNIFFGFHEFIFDERRKKFQCTCAVQNHRPLCVFPSYKLYANKRNRFVHFYLMWISYKHKEKNRDRIRN